MKVDSFLLFFIVLPYLSYGTLSKLDRKVIKKQKPSNADKENKNSLKLGNSEKERLLNEKEIVYHGKRIFPNPTLAYVTPWNGRGYDIAKFAAKKFTHLSPVWFQVIPSVKEKNCIIEGTHDIDQGWMADVHTNNSELHIVPRFIFEKWTPSDYRDFIHSEIWQTNCVKRVVNLILRNQMQGAVLEVWTQIISVLDSMDRIEALEFISTTGVYFHNHQLQLIITLPPELDATLRPIGITQPSEIAKLAENVDFMHIMTYDFKADTLRGVSPLFWIRENVGYLIGTSASIASKLLLGVNFYGYKIKEKRLSPVIASSFKELLRETDTILYWDRYSEEHFAYSKKRKEMTYFPSLDSVSKRLDLAKDLNVGIGIWEIGQGFDYFTKLL